MPNKTQFCYQILILLTSLYLIGIGALLVCQGISYDIQGSTMIAIGAIMLVLSFVLILYLLSAISKFKPVNKLPYLYLLFVVLVFSVLSGIVSIVNGVYLPVNLNLSLAIGAITTSVGSISSLMVFYYMLFPIDKTFYDHLDA